MAFFKKVYQKLLGEEADEELEGKELTETVEDAADNTVVTEDMAEEKNIRDFSAGASRSLELKIAKLTAFDGNVMEVADHLIAGRPVVLNLEGASREAIRRIIDFFSGVAYTVRGQLKNISGGIYIVTPSTVDVSSEATLLTGTKATPAEARNSVGTASVPTTPGASPYEGF